MNEPVELPWAITREKVDAVVQRLAEASHPRKIILFGSYVRGQVHRDSDLDILIISKDDLKNPREESVRLRDVVNDIDMPMDILVIPESQFNELKEVPGLIYREAWESGKIVYEHAG